MAAEEFANVHGYSHGSAMRKIECAPIEPFRNHVERTMLDAGKPLPNPEEAQDWMVTEIGEMINTRIQLSGNGKWVRNNPEKHKAPSIDREIGNVVYIASMTTEKDILQIIDKKLKEKGQEDTPLTPCTQ